MAEYIEREYAREKLCSMCRWEGTANCDECEHPIDDIHAADVRPVVHAHWVDVRQEGVCAWTAECSNCWTRNDIPPVELAHYCPSCGAVMDEEVDNG